MTCTSVVKGHQHSLTSSATVGCPESSPHILAHESGHELMGSPREKQEQVAISCHGADLLSLSVG